jgi:protein-S-isoprenylcysteine O-methyltransferase Ste14
MPDPAPKRPKFWRAVVVHFGLLAVAVACLVQWGTDHPWSRIDGFTGSYLVINLMFRARQMRGIRHTVFRSNETLREASGQTFDPASRGWMPLLSLGNPLAFLDYGHLHLVPALENPVLQSLGLALYVAGELTWYWVDTHLQAHFAQDLSDRSLIAEGPYQYVRHPRYTGLVVGKIGVALIFASLIGWCFALAWLVLLVQRIPREEAHLTKVFGSEYESYVRRTSRLIPGLY